MTSLEQVAHTVHDGIETYRFESAVYADHFHEVTSVDGGPWTIGPVDIPYGDATVDQATAYAAELSALIAFARKLEDCQAHRAHIKAEQFVNTCGECRDDKSIAPPRSITPHRIQSWCAEFAAHYRVYGRPIVSHDDPRLEALIAHGLVDAYKLAGGVEPDESKRLGSLYFDRFADDKPEQLLAWPEWAQTVHVETSDYPVVGIRFEAIVSAGDTVSARWIKSYGIVAEDFSTPKSEARMGEIWFADDAPVLEVQSGDRRLDLLELPDVLTFADAITAAANVMRTAGAVESDCAEF